MQKQLDFLKLFFIGVVAGIFGAIVKWGWEIPFPPRNPEIFFPIDSLERTTPPKIFLEQLGLPTDWFYIFSGIELPLSIFIVHIGFSIFFALFYCFVAQKHHWITKYQGILFGIFVYFFAHVFLMPIMQHTPPLGEIPFDEHLSEFFGHIVWMWSIEIVRNQLKNSLKV